MTDLNPADYVRNLDLLVGATTALTMVADEIDIPGMRSVCEQMQALAPVLEPTAYQRGGMTALREQAAFLAALEAFVTEVRKLDRPATRRTAMSDHEGDRP
ncbi:hypothetical protein [Actinoallomurus sp. CA-142502]|uniref:hypothetical protein n=1 Tax=Actinoallomurus sp. CA-142502 TaxID=3239885 RepID=UPI003D8DEA29